MKKYGLYHTSVHKENKKVGEKICENGVCNETVVINKVDRIFMFDKNLEIL